MAVFRGEFRRCPNDGTLLVESEQDPLVGTVLAERYQIEAVLGDGGLGRVYRARHVRMSRRFAIKIPFGEVGYDRKSRARLANEAEAASRLDHPNVIGVVDVGESSAGLFYLAMELADGPSLAEVLDSERLTPHEALTLFAQMSDGLTHAHERGLVHRDLKPNNMIVVSQPDGTRRIRIIDFGLALLDDGSGHHRVTTEGMVVGTPDYMAPEQAMGDAVDHRTDLFALGIILFEMLAGRMPFDGGPIDVARQNLSTPLPTVLARTGVAADPLHEAAIRWLTRKRLSERPPTTRIVFELGRHLATNDRDAAISLLPRTLRPGSVAPTLEPIESSAALVAVPIVESVTVPDLAPIAVPVAELIVAPVAESVAAPIAESEFDDELVERSPRRRWLAIAALLALAIVIVVVAIAVWPRDRGTASTPNPVAATDAGVIDAGSELDARDDVIATLVDAGPAASIDARVASSTRPRDPIDARPAINTRPTPSIDAGARPVATNSDVDTLSLKALYVRVATDLRTAADRLGPARTAQLQRKFSAVPPYLDAARKPSLRAEAESQLRALAREIAGSN